MKDNGINKILQYYGLHPGSCKITEFLRGHINDSYVIDVRGTCAFFLQRINHHVFTDPEGLINNLIQVNNRLKAYYRDVPNPYPELIQNRNKKSYFLDDEGNYWRMMSFVPESRSFNVCESPEIAREGAAAFGLFQKIMSKEDTASYTPTIPDFHHLGKRLSKLQEAIKMDEFDRCGKASEEIAFALDRNHFGVELQTLIDKGITPERITHNDTKLNNVLFRNDSIKSICVVDLDTVMPGTVLFDYGDMVRTFTSAAEEDEPDPAKVIFRREIFEALTQGYLSELKDSLTQGEKENLLFGAKVMLLMIGVRFLTDFLEGDHYFKTARENHNLERCRNQFILLRQLEEKEDELLNIIMNYC
jgi:hypothetical protein